MTLAELKTLTDDVITPQMAASVLKCDANLIRVTARQKPELLGFPVIVMKSRTKIPRVPFIKYLEGN